LERWIGGDRTVRIGFGGEHTDRRGANLRSDWLGVRREGGVTRIVGGIRGRGFLRSDWLLTRSPDRSSVMAPSRTAIAKPCCRLPVQVQTSGVTSTVRIGNILAPLFY
jgi:hypothetical protein